MSEQLKEKILLIQTYFNDFNNFIELDGLRSFLLFTLTSQATSNILAQLGLGGSKDIINLAYNPISKIYYQKVNLLTAKSLIIYVKADPLTKEFILEKDNPIFKQFLNSNEMSLAFRAKEKFIFPNISDCSNLDIDEKTKLNIKIDDLYHSLESFVAVAEPNLLFVLDAKNSNKPDLIFSVNMMPEMPGKMKKNVLKIDVFLDEEHKTQGITYLKREEDYTLKYLKDIKEVSHSDLYKSSFSLILHIKSFNTPY